MRNGRQGDDRPRAASCRSRIEDLALSFSNVAKRLPDGGHFFVGGHDRVVVKGNKVYHKHQPAPQDAKDSRSFRRQVADNGASSYPELRGLEKEIGDWPCVPR